MVVCRRSVGRALALAGLIAFGGSAGPIAFGGSAAVAQAVDCNRLYATIQAGGAGTGTGRWTRAVQQQQREIDRTQRYADQLRCGESGGLFGIGAPPECGGVQDRLQRMQENLANLEAQSDQPQADESGRKAALIARYNAQCVGGSGANPAALAQGGDRGFLPDDGRNPADMPDPDRLSSVPLDGDIMDGSGEPRQALGQAICVRSCDGGYFPLSPRATQDQLGGLEQLCEASCPNTEARLYTMGKDGDLATATAVDGTSYTALPAAFQFEKTFVPACTCKPPHQSWVQALADAEKLLGDPGRHDITVTASMSDQMAKPGAAPAAGGKGAKVPRAAALAQALPDVSMVREAQKGALAPTASHETTGIGGPVSTERVVRAGDGPTIAIAGPDGVRKTIRLIVP